MRYIWGYGAIRQRRYPKGASRRNCTQAGAGMRMWTRSIRIPLWDSKSRWLKASSCVGSRFAHERPAGSLLRRQLLERLSPPSPRFPESVTYVLGMTCKPESTRSVDVHRGMLRSRYFSCVHAHCARRAPQLWLRALNRLRSERRAVLSRLRRAAIRQRPRIARGSAVPLSAQLRLAV